MRQLDSAVRHVMGAHTLLYRHSRGILGHHVPGLPPMLLLDHVGAKSGTKRTSPLVYLEDGDDVVIVASKGGSPRNPAWFHNLQREPGHERADRLGDSRGTRPRRDTRRAKAPLAEGRRPLRRLSSYQDRTEREIPLVILEQRG